MVEIGFFPILLRMALLAFLAFLAFMLIVGLMAVITCGAEFFSIQNALMAGLAFRFEMLAAQSVLGVTIVVEIRRFPGFLAMAGFAFFTVLAFMFVVFLVAAKAV